MSAVASYVQLRDGDSFVGSSRVTLRSVVEGWKRGDTPEHIQQSYPSLSLVAVFGAMTFYLEHRGEVEANFRELDALRVTNQAAEEAKHPEFYAEMRRRIAEHRAAQGRETRGSTDE